MHLTADDVSTPAPRWPAAVPETPDAPLVGRAAELEELRRLTLDGEARFVTLIGIGGVGKSRLAAELAIRELAARDGRIAFVALDAVSDASLVLPAIAGALGVADEPGRSVVEAVSEALGRAPTLLVLDTLEHVRAAAPDLSDLRARTLGLTIVATSRIALGVPRERLVWVEPLPVPAEGEHDHAAVEGNPAVALFVERARAVRPDFATTPANAAIVAAICRRLDGIPLAIELAAAALRVLAPHQLLDQLAERLAEPAAGGLGTGEPGTGQGGPERQRSMRAAMDWSIGLLPEPVQRLYRRVGVIAGSFHPSTAAAILERGERRGLLPLGIDVHDGLRRLSAASLLRWEPGDREPSYTMLSTVRADALDRLARSGEAVAMRWAHAYEVLALVEAAERDLPTDRERQALDRLESGHDDIREALEWAMQQGDGAFALRIAGPLAEFWRTRGHHTEGRLRLAAALALAPDAPDPYRRKALAGAGLLASYQGDYVLAESYLQGALAMARTEADENAAAAILNWLGTNAYGGGDLATAERYVSESLELRRRTGDALGIATALNALGGVYHFRGDLDRAREVFEESLAIKKALGNESAIAVALTNLGLVERDAGRPQPAAEAFREAIAIWERTGDRQRVAVGIHNAALLALDLGAYADAAAGLDRAHEIARELGDRTEMAYAMADRVRVDVERGDLEAAEAALGQSLPRALGQSLRIVVALGLEGAGALAAARGDDGLAVRLWAAAAAERASSGFANMPADERLLQARMDTVRERIDPAAFAAAWSAGLELPVEAASAEALTLVAPARSV
ncbi:MAG: tetratricopeptide repeat protein [Chloroflexota bacterium]